MSTQCNCCLQWNNVASSLHQARVKCRARKTVIGISDFDILINSLLKFVKWFLDCRFYDAEPHHCTENKFTLVSVEFISHHPVFNINNIVLEHCNPWPHVANRHISISQLLSLWHHCHYDVIRASRAYGARSPCSNYDVILIMTSFTTELATPTATDVRTPYTV